MKKIAKSKPKKKKVIKFVPRFYTSGTGPIPSKKVYITSSELRELVANQLGSKLSRNFGFYISDASFYCPPVYDAREIIRHSKVVPSKGAYIASF